MKKFRDRIEELRSDKTQRAVAKEIGVPLNTYTNWTRGIRMPSIENIVNICVQLGVSADWLLGVTDSGSAAVKRFNAAAAEKEDKKENDDQGITSEKNKVCMECVAKEARLDELRSMIARLTGQVSVCASPPAMPSGGEQDRASKAW